jgi:hypothetical protein
MIQLFNLYEQDVFKYRKLIFSKFINRFFLLMPIKNS